jgi:hypothetical protein
VLNGVDGSREAVPSTVFIGGLDRAALRSALRVRDVRLNRAAEALFHDRRFTTSSGQFPLHIACLSVADLGFVHGAVYEQLTQRATNLGFSECPLELGPYLRLQMGQQPELPDLPDAPPNAPPGSITIASRPIDDTEETPKGFYLRKISGALWLRGYWAPTTHVWNPNDLLVFARSHFKLLPQARGNAPNKPLQHL